VIRTILVVALALSGASAATAHAAQNPLAAALKHSAAQPRVQVLLTGRCEQADKPKRCTVRTQSDRAGYHYYRASLPGTSIRMLRVAGSDHIHSSVLKPSPRCWLGEERAGDIGQEFSVEVTSSGATLRSLAHDLRNGTITRRGRTITRVRGDERASFTLDGKGRVKRGVLDDPDEGRFRLTVTYPVVPFKQVTPAPECTDEQVAELIED
jgi:hypothetical protein